MDYPLLVLVSSFILLALTIRVGDAIRKKSPPRADESRADASLLLSSTLMLLYFIIGFTFSMAINRYDLRKSSEQAEALAIGTEYSRADLLALSDQEKVKALLRQYLDQRVSYYTTRSHSRASEIQAETARLQSELWSTIRLGVAAVPAPLMGLLIGGMNDVINAQRSSLAASFNRIPLTAWVLMVSIAVGCCCLIGSRAKKTDWLAFMIVPLSASVSFFLIADLDSPRGGSILVAPVNLSSLSQTISR